jgi:cytochrome P450 family 72 subfamily A61
VFLTYTSEYYDINTGKSSFMWLGPRPRVFIMEPDKIKEMTTKIYDFQKPDTSPLFKLLASGFINYEGDKWAKHRKIISPAFNVEKMKVVNSSNLFNVNPIFAILM